MVILTGQYCVMRTCSGRKQQTARPFPALGSHLSTSARSSPPQPPPAHLPRFLLQHTRYNLLQHVNVNASGFIGVRSVLLGRLCQGVLAEVEAWCARVLLLAVSDNGSELCSAASMSDIEQEVEDRVAKGVGLFKYGFPPPSRRPQTSCTRLSAI